MGVEGDRRPVAVAAANDQVGDRRQAVRAHERRRAPGGARRRSRSLRAASPSPRRAARCRRAACRSARAPAPAGSGPRRRSARRSRRRGARRRRSCALMRGRAFRGEAVEKLQEGLDRQLHVVGGARFERVVADAGVLAAHEQHRLRHHLADLHRVVAGAARHAVHRQAERRRRRAPSAPASRAPTAMRRRASSPRGRTTRPRRSQIASQLGEHVVDAGVAHRVGGGADVERELAAAGNDVGRSVRHLEHAHRADQVRRLRGALLEEDGELGDRRGGVAPARHRRRAGVARHAAHLAGEAHAAVDRGDDAERQAELVQHRPLLDVDLDEAEVVGGLALELRRSRAGSPAARRGASRRASRRRRRRPGRATSDRTGRRARPSRGRSPCSAGLPPRRRRRARARTAGAGRPGSARARDHRHEDAEAAVVAAAVAYRVVVRAGQQRLRVRRRRAIDADDVADRVDLDARRSRTRASSARAAPPRRGARR